MKTSSIPTSEASFHPYSLLTNLEDQAVHRVGIIGCGVVVAKAVAQAVQKSQRARLEVLGSRSLDRVKTLASQFQCRAVEGYDQIINDPKVDIVYIALPNALHLEWILKAAKAGKHVICEKPAVLNPQEAGKVVGVCKRHCVRFLEAYMFWFHPQHRQVEKLIESRAIGKVFHFEGAFGFPPLGPNNFRYSRSLGGGALYDAGGYPIAAARRLFREEPIATSASLFYPEGYEVDIRGAAQLEFPGGKTAHIAFGFDNSYRNTYTLWGTRGLIRLNSAFTVPPTSQACIDLITPQGTETIKVAPADHFTLMIDVFCQVIQRYSEMENGFEDEFLAQCETVNAVASAARDGKRIRLIKK